MANPAIAPSGVHVRPLADPLHPVPRRETHLTLNDAAWDVLGGVLNQQLNQDALLLWSYDRRHGRIELLASAPQGSADSGLMLAVPDQFVQLVSQSFEAIAHVQCALSECPLDKRLWQFGLHSAISTILASEPDQAWLLTCGFRQRWQLVAHHLHTLVALTTYLREWQRQALPAVDCHRWWRMPSQVPHLWRQSYRPSVIRTIHDLNAVLADLSDRCREGEPALTVRPNIVRMAHQGAELMARLESIYWDSRPLVSTEELLSEAMLLVRGAYQLCLGEWPGCSGAVRDCPRPLQTSPNAIRQGLIDWILQEIAAEQQAA